MARNRLIELTIGEFRASLWRTAMATSTGRPILVGRGFRVKGAPNITVTDGQLKLGTDFYGFADPRMGGLLRVRGRLEARGSVRISHGNRWDVGPDATVVIGAGTSFSPGTRLVATSAVSVGEDCAIGWDCQILDDDFHVVATDVSAARPRSLPIAIGDRVWISSQVSIFKGSQIADGCVVAARSVVRGVFPEPSCLIAGAPARIIRHEVSWK